MCERDRQYSIRIYWHNKNEIYCYLYVEISLCNKVSCLFCGDDIAPHVIYGIKKEIMKETVFNLLW